MYLVDVKRVGFKCAVLNRPIFDRSDFSYDRRFFIRFENLLPLAVDGNVKLDRAVCAAELFGEEEFSLRCCRLLREIRDLLAKR